MAFRIQELMTDVLPGFQLANERCSCQVSADVARLPADEALPADELVDPVEIQEETGDDATAGEEQIEALAADLVVLRARLRRSLELGG